MVVIEIGERAVRVLKKHINMYSFFSGYYSITALKAEQFTAIGNVVFVRYR